MNVDEALEAHVRLVAEIVDDVLGACFRGERATLEVEGVGPNGETSFTIRPTRQDACPVVLHCDIPGEVEFFMGRYSLAGHIWESKNPPKFERELREYLTAIVEGRYEEKVRLLREDESRAGKGKGTFHPPTGPATFSYSNLSTLGGRGPWQRVEYAPYA